MFVVTGINRLSGEEIIIYDEWYETIEEAKEVIENCMLAENDEFFIYEITPAQRVVHASPKISVDYFYINE